MKTKNTEFLRAITGPKIEYNGSPVTRYSTWSIGGGLKVDENPFFNKLNLSVDDQHIIDLINQHGGNSSDWSEYPAVQNVDMDGNSITNLAEPVLPSDAATKDYVDGAVPDRIVGTNSLGETMLGVGQDATGLSSRVILGRVSGSVFLRSQSPDNSSGTGFIGWYQGSAGNNAWHDGYFRWSTGIAEMGSNHRTSVGGSYVRCEYWNGGQVTFYTPKGGSIELVPGASSATPSERSLPSGVNSIVHGIHIAKEAYDELANYDWSEYPAGQNVDMDGHKLTGLGEPTDAADAATKGYVDSITGIASTISEGELYLPFDAANTSENVTTTNVSNIRFTRIGDIVTLSGYFNVLVNDSGTATVAHTGLTGAALPMFNSNWYSMITTSTQSSSFKKLKIEARASGDLRFTVYGATATAYETNFVITYRGAAL